jgi:hypothetical protein
MRGLKGGVLLAGLAALIAAGIAVADASKPAAMTSVTAHITAQGNLRTMACTAMGASGKGSSGNASSAVKTKRVSFSGTSTSTESRLNGSLQMNLRIVVGRNGLGFATGVLRIGKLEANLTAVVTNTNQLDGFVRAGHSLFANFSGTLSKSSGTATSTLNADLGTGNHVNTAIVSIGGGCES